jgi:hypothetical protein
MKDSTRALVNEIATQFGVSPATLVGIIQNESGWNPTIKNPTSSARGLIQFMDATAKSMGFPGGSAELIAKYPDVDSQLSGPVRNYYKQFAPYANDNEFILATFYPAWRKKALGTALPANVVKANPGLNTLGDYVNRIKARIAGYKIAQTFK